MSTYDIVSGLVDGAWRVAICAFPAYLIWKYRRAWLAEDSVEAQVTETDDTQVAVPKAKRNVAPYVDKTLPTLKTIDHAVAEYVTNARLGAAA